ncbi:hypothetical protein [Vibrio sp.]|uniref:hypothetical protein n=1 Tax=Vibrio sp. TaxID=678 RepID=UPI003D0A6020
MTKPHRGALCILGLTLISGYCSAQVPGLEPEKDWQLGGYVKYMLTYTLPDHQSNTLDHLIHQRFNFEYRFKPGWSFNAGMRNRLLAGDSVDIPYYKQLASHDTGYWDLNRNLIEEDSWFVNSQFDRLFVDWKNSDWNARLGRFRINWSMNTIWNPNDLLNAYSIYDFDYEERAGSDALLIGRNLGIADGFELVFSPKRDQQLNDYLARYYGNYSGWDYQLIGGKNALDNVIGAGFATDWYGAGIRGEYSWYQARRDYYQGRRLSNNQVFSLESDYSFASDRNWLLRAAYLYIEHPLAVFSAQSYLSLPLNSKSLSFSRHTGYVEVGFDLTPLNRTALSSVIYDDGSYFVGLSNSYSLANDWQLLAVLQRFDGAGGSLFGDTPATLLFANIRWSF